MQGSTVDSMADAIDGAYIILYGISQAYKDSQNCRVSLHVTSVLVDRFDSSDHTLLQLEAMYCHQTGVNMVPLMLEDNYRANGWLGEAIPALPHQLAAAEARCPTGMLLGTRLWYLLRQTFLLILNLSPSDPQTNLAEQVWVLWTYSRGQQPVYHEA